MLAQQPAGLRERQVLAVVTAEPEPIAIRQQRQRPQQSKSDEGTEPPRVGIGCRRAHQRRRRALLAGGRIERRQPTRSIERDRPGAAPARRAATSQAAAAVKISKQRSAFAVSLLQAEKIGVDRVGQLARAAARIDGVGRPIQDRTVLAHEMIPGGVVALGTGARERQILEVERGQVSLQALTILRPSGSALAALRSSAAVNDPFGHTPPRGLACW